MNGHASLIAAVVLLGVLYARSPLVTPLYHREFGLSAMTSRLVYATYLISNVCALLEFGSLSDQAGPRLVGELVLAVGAQARSCS